MKVTFMMLYLNFVLQIVNLPLNLTFYKFYIEYDVLYL